MNPPKTVVHNSQGHPILNNNFTINFGINVPVGLNNTIVPDCIVNRMLCIGKMVAICP